MTSEAKANSYIARFSALNRVQCIYEQWNNLNAFTDMGT